MHNFQTTDSDLDRAAELLRQGRLVAFPTETVYGLGCDASSEAALKRLYLVKGRPVDHPVIVHIAAVADLEKWAAPIPPAAYKLAEAFWPGPLTLILPRAAQVSRLVTGGQDSVGLRVPAHPLARKLIERFGGGLAAPSANRFGRLSPTTAQAVREGLGDDVDMVLDGGPCDVGIESTIVSLVGERPAILRPGMIDVKAIEAVLGLAVEAGSAATAKTKPDQGDAIRVPGALPSHYAPRTPMAVAQSADIIELFGEGLAIGRNQGVIAFEETVEAMKSSFGQGFLNAMEFETWIVAPDDAGEYARRIYDSLRRLDQLALHKILVEAVPTGTAWDGVRDRLTRASAPQL
ncbi:MAG: threonylcarbamoyl-AMP synthase [Cyanobacteria bacterium REEB67]|nr:threonylcarbamoyl-AMP synthase [Cyanobacteria bacterium REEB67]